MLRCLSARGKSYFILLSLFVAHRASAAPLVVPNVPLGGPDASFSAVLGISGNVTANASGTAIIFPVNVPTQTRPLTLASSPNVATTPVGSSTLGFDDVTLEDASLESTTIDVTNGSTIPFTLGQVVFNGTLGGSAMTVTANISGSLQEISFMQAAGPLPASGPFDLPGVISARVVATIDAVAASGFISIPFSQEIDSVASGDTTLPGALALTDLEPSGSYPRNVGADLSGGTDLVFNVDDSGDFEFNEDGIDVSGTFVLDLDITLSDIEYNLGATINDVLYPAGDANRDGMVTGADYTIWADHFDEGPGATVSDGDFNNDGHVTGADYTIWADNFGVGTPSMPVPEPGTLALAGVAVAGLLVTIRRRAAR